MTEFFRSFFSTQIWINTTSIIGVFFAIYLSILTNKQLLRGNKNVIIPAIFVILVTLYIGTRPLWCYCDTLLYTMIFDYVQSGIWESLPSENGSEQFFCVIEQLCIQTTDASGWLLVVATFYVVGISVAAYRWLPQHIMIALLFMYTSAFFWPYATNTIRQGMATSIALLGLSYFCRGKVQLSIGYGLLIVALMTHKSTALILVAATSALFLRNTKSYIYIWLGCIVVGLFAQDFFKICFSNMVDDSRMNSYTTMTGLDSKFSQVGFRYDFILYSSIPILMGWYVIIKKNIMDNIYKFLLHTYILANSVWVLINSTAFSDRFAYLSWFMYPILLAYPLCKHKIFQRQGLVAGLILISIIIITYILVG